MTDFQYRLWSYLITYVDDYGRGSADPELLKGFVFPRRKRTNEADIQKALAELAGMGCINLYNVDGESYFYFPNWGDHQRIQTKKSKFPEPSDVAENEVLQESTVNHGGSPPESNPNPNTNPNSNPKESTASRFAPPSLEDVKAYCSERKNSVDPEQFYNFYASKGWYVGKNKMKDWKACVHTWENREKGKKLTVVSNAPNRAEIERRKKLLAEMGEPAGG